VRKGASIASSRRDIDFFVRDQRAGVTQTVQGYGTPEYSVIESEHYAKADKYRVWVVTRFGTGDKSAAAVAGNPRLDAFVAYLRPVDAARVAAVHRCLRA
jgi:hypothetical protein